LRISRGEIFNNQRALEKSTQVSNASWEWAAPHAVLWEPFTLTGNIRVSSMLADIHSTSIRHS
jgi:hypothetical protein